MVYAPLGQGNRNEMYREPYVFALAERYGKSPAQVIGDAAVLRLSHPYPYAWARSLPSR